MDSHYPIGTPGIPWGDDQKAIWRAAQTTKRSYQAEVLNRIVALEGTFELQRYGELDYRSLDGVTAVKAGAAVTDGAGLYPLFGLLSRDWHSDRPAVLITGGVHGYETSGVHGALRFLETAAHRYERYFNVAVAPCVSPWGYETINRWNPKAIDPNRSFYRERAAELSTSNRKSSADSALAEEACLLMTWVDSVAKQCIAHFDLHETTDTDNSEFRPALAARDAVEQKAWDIPDGFYLVGDTAAPAPDFQRAVINAVSEVTHIAPSDAGGRIIGVPTEQPGVINYDVGGLGLCAGVTSARYRTTTEVYPDSPRVDPENCIRAQVAAVCGGLDYILTQL